MDIENLISTFSYVAIFAFMVTNGIISLPSSQFVYVVAGVFVPSGQLAFVPIIISGTMGNVLGNTILYEATVRKGLGYITKWRFFSEKRIQGLEIAMNRRGIFIIFLGKFLPGIKVVVPIVAGLAKMHKGYYCLIISITSLLWAIGLTYLGVYFGKDFGSSESKTLTVILVGLACLAIYLFCRYVRSISILE